MAVFLATTPLRGPATGEPRFVEYGPSFRSMLTGIVVSRDGTVWVQKNDGVAHVSRDGRIVEKRRADDCPYYCGSDSNTIGIGPDGAIWTDGGDRVLRFTETTSRAFHIATPPNWRTRVAAFAADDSGVYASFGNAAGLRRIDKQGREVQLLSGVPNIVKVAARHGTVWALSSQNDYGPPVHVYLTVYTAGVQKTNIATDYLANNVVQQLAVAPDGALFVAISGPAGFGISSPLRILRVAPDGRVREVASIAISQVGFAGGSIGGLAVGANETVWFTLPYNNKIGSVSSSGSVNLYRRGIANGARPTAIALDRDGSVWYTNPAQGTVEHWMGDGSVRVFGSGISPINIPGPPVVTSDGAMWFTETLSWHPRVVRRSADGTYHQFQLPSSSIERLGALQSLGTDVGLTVTSMTETSIYVVHPDGQIEKRDSAGCMLTTGNFTCLPGSRIRFNNPNVTPNWVVRAPDGNLWFTDDVHSLIGRVTPNGKYSLFTSGLTRWHSGPQYIAVGPDGALWFTEIRDRIGRVTLDGRITEFSNLLPFRSFAGGIVAGRDGNLWFTIYHGNELVRMTPNGAITRFRNGIYPSRGNDYYIPDSVPVVDGHGDIWFNEPQGGRIACAYGNSP